MSEIYPRNQFVPIVVKNRDFLTGFLRALNHFEIGEMKTDTILSLSSARFTDMLPGNVRRRNVEIEEQIQVMIDYRMSMMSHEEGVEEVSSEDFEFEDGPLLELNCECGNYVKFETEKDIPKTSYRCDICGKHMIDYTNREDSDYVYDGDLEKHIEFADVMDMVFGNDDDEDSGDDEA